MARWNASAAGESFGRTNSFTATLPGQNVLSPTKSRLILIEVGALPVARVEHEDQLAVGRRTPGSGE